MQKLIETGGVVLSLAVYPDRESFISYEGNPGFSRDEHGTLGVTASYALHVRNARCGEQVDWWWGLPTPIERLEVSPDSRRIVGVDQSGNVSVWDAESLVPLVEATKDSSHRDLLGSEKGVWGLDGACFPPRVLAGCGTEIFVRNGLVCARSEDRSQGAILLAEEDADRMFLAISNDGRILAVWADEESNNHGFVFETDDLLCAPEWDKTDPGLPGSQAIAVLSTDQGVKDMIFSPDNKRIALRFLCGVGIWDLDKKEFRVLKQDARFITAFAFQGNNKLLVGRLGDGGKLPGTIESWDLQDGQ
jgi:WD40 repeat protein